MKHFAKLIAHCVLPAVGGLLLGATLVSLGISLYGLASTAASFEGFAVLWSLGLLMAIFAVAYGIIPMLLFGAPAYAALRYFGRANYLTVAILGAVPGLFLLIFKPDFGWLFLMFGIPTALIVHFLARWSAPLQRLGANNSFKPRPLRGSA